jgi:hypothetical protein
MKTYLMQFYDKKIADKAEHIWTFMLEVPVHDMQIFPHAFTSHHLHLHCQFHLTTPPYSHFIHLSLVVRLD